MAEHDLYLKVRQKEGRLYSDEVVAKLPSFQKNHALSNEWQARFKSAKRLRSYLTQKNTSLKILDLGCGNGWLSNFLNQENHSIYGVDQNLFELQQATRVFLSSAEDGEKSEKLFFLKADIFSAPFPIESFDVILLASAVQYFPDLSRLLQTLFNYLKPNGEIHILDSAFYKDDEIPQAIKRSEEYYQSLGLPEMSRYYFHHRLSELQKFSPRFLYKPMLLRFKKILGKMDSPFAWVMIQK
ncbi:MAG: methylase [Chloroflexi bacterium OLB14]|nr:MAG: methylase [Chloroflexi bacterium OLB14]